MNSVTTLMASHNTEGSQSYDNTIDQKKVRSVQKSIEKRTKRIGELGDGEEAEEVGHYFGAGAGGTTAKKPRTAQKKVRSVQKSIEKRTKRIGELGDGEEAEEVGHYFGAGAGGTTAKKPQTARLASAATTKSALECPVCNTKFANPFNARRHMVNKHGMTAPVALAQLPAIGE
jgi:hypothetical protein